MRNLARGAAVMVVAGGGYAAIYRLGQTWGASAQEQRQSLPGDELLTNATAWTTHAITIEAPPATVWPWLVQMGWGRAGWYTYRWVDRLLFPANGPSANQLLPQYQQLAVGDRVPDGPPEADCWFRVERLEPGRLLVLRSTRHLPASWRQRGLAMDWIWSWHLHEPTSGSTRLIQRNRMRLEPAWFERAFLATIVPADFIMARSHLRGLQVRAELATPSSGTSGDAPGLRADAMTSPNPWASLHWKQQARAIALEPVGPPALSTSRWRLHPEGVGVASGIGKEVSWMQEITLADYKQADRELEREEARRGFTIHAIVYAVVMTGLIILNLTVATEFPWAVLPLVCWGMGLTLHYLFGVRWVGKVITDRQAKVEQRAAATIRRAA